MCRWFAMISAEPILLSDVIITPKHSLVKQIDSHFLPDIHIEYHANDDGSPNPLSNLDGFGLSWYTNTAREFDVEDENDTPMPCFYKSVRPPLNDRNLLSLAENTSSNCVFAHIRAGTGLTPTVETNNHPFIFGKFLFMHNGVLSHFFDIKLSLLRLLSPEARAQVYGTTDSEHIGALFFTNLDPKGPWLREYDMKELKKAMRKTIKDLQRLVDEVGGDDDTTHSALNFALADGQQLLATRFSHPPTREPPSLYYSTKAGATLNKKYQDHPDSPVTPCALENRRQKTEEHGMHCIVASEPSTYRKEEWELIKAGGMISVRVGEEPSFQMI